MKTLVLDTTLRLDQGGHDGVIEDTLIRLAPGFQADPTLNCVLYGHHSETRLVRVGFEGYGEWRPDNLRFLRSQGPTHVYLEDVYAHGVSQAVVELEETALFTTRGRVDLYNGHCALSFGQAGKEVAEVDSEGLHVHDSWGPRWAKTVRGVAMRPNGQQRRVPMGATCASGVPLKARWKGLRSSGSGNASFKYGKSGNRSAGLFEDCVLGGVMFDEADELEFRRCLFTDVGSRYDVDRPTMDTYYQVDGGEALAVECAFVADPWRTRHAIHLHRKAHLTLERSVVLGDSIRVYEDVGAQLDMDWTTRWHSTAKVDTR